MPKRTPHLPTLPPKPPHLQIAPVRRAVEKEVEEEGKELAGAR